MLQGKNCLHHLCMQGLCLSAHHCAEHDSSPCTKPANHRTSVHITPAKLPRAVPSCTTLSYSHTKSNAMSLWMPWDTVMWVPGASPPAAVMFRTYQAGVPVPQGHNSGGEGLAQAAHCGTVRWRRAQEPVHVPVVAGHGSCLAHGVIPQHVDGFVQPVLHFVLLEGQERETGLC